MNLKILCIAIMVMLVCSGGVSIESTATDTIKVMWNPDNKEINIVERYKKEDIIANKETALTMGKALLKEYFADEVKDESVYGVLYTEGGLYYMNLWRISVIFEPDRLEYSDLDIVLNGDAFIDIEPTSGRFCVSDNRPYPVDIVSTLFWNREKVLKW